MAASLSVFDQLSRSRAQLHHRLDLGRGRGAAVWSNEADRVRYENTQLHTLSLYLVGGEESRRMDRGAIRGRPGALCLLPQGSGSDWAIGGAFRFVHLYLADDRLRHFVAETLDREPASLTLADRTYYDEPRLAAALARLAQAVAAADVPRAEGLIEEICHALVTSAANGGRPARPIRGGLAPVALRRALEAMRVRIEAPPSLEELAREAGLSPFHFQRMYRVSRGVTPAAEIEAMRVGEAKRLIAAGVGLAEVAAACGFCHQSHFTRAFRAAVGTTPGAWRRATEGS